MGKVIAPHLMVLYKKIMKTSDILAINNISQIIPLLKSDKDPAKPGSYRPVVLTELFMRVLEKILK